MSENRWMVETRDLGKTYEDGHVALVGLNLEVAGGEAFVLLGPNGAGKTTTLNLLMGHLRPTKGEAYLDGVNVHEDTLEAKKRFAYLPENVSLYGNFTARQNLEFFAKLGGVKSMGRQECTELLVSVGLPGAAVEKEARHLSKGMRQKVCLAITIAKEAQVLFLDEPAAGLDPRSAEELVAQLERLKSAGRTMILCTHDVFRAAAIADRIGIMADGELRAVESGPGMSHRDIIDLYLEATSQSKPAGGHVQSRP